MIESVKLTNPFKVNMLSEVDFFDFKKAADTFINTTKLKISEISWIRVNSNESGKILVKKTFCELEQWTEISVFKKGVTKKNMSSSIAIFVVHKSHCRREEDRFEKYDRVLGKT